MDLDKTEFLLRSYLEFRLQKLASSCVLSWCCMEILLELIFLLGLKCSQRSTSVFSAFSSNSGGNRQGIGVFFAFSGGCFTRVKGRCQPSGGYHGQTVVIEDKDGVKFQNVNYIISYNFNEKKIEITHNTEVN